MSDPDHFLARWSRRKRDVGLSEAKPPPPAGAVDEAGRDPHPAEPAFPSDEPLPTLPSLLEITAETDITGFLAKTVPESLRNAALRRMWLLDPKIRDHVGDARDYAWDWNTPGGVPGFGEIAPSYDVQGTIARMFGEVDEPAQEEAGTEEPPTAEPPTDADPGSQDGPSESESALCEPEQTEGRPLTDGADRESAPADAATTDQPPSEDEAQRPRTGPLRHGGATPA